MEIRLLMTIILKVKKKVREKSIQSKERYGDTSGQLCTMESFPTKNRRLFLFPDYNPRD